MLRARKRKNKKASIKTNIKTNCHKCAIDYIELKVRKTVRLLTPKLQQFTFDFFQLLKKKFDNFSNNQNTTNLSKQ